jgi:hypothetical protein
MEDVNKLFGLLQMKRVGQVRLEAINATEDIFVAQVSNGSTDRILAIATAPTAAKGPSVFPLSQIQWHTLHIRSYKSNAAVEAICKTLKIDSSNLGDLQNIPMVDWGTQDDIVLESVEVQANCKTYDSQVQLPFKVTLHSVNANNKHGNELEHSLELIPALMTCNFTLVA